MTKGLFHWQEKTRPVMIFTLLVLTAFFILIAILQFQLLHDVLQSGPSLSLETFQAEVEIKDGMGAKDHLEATQWRQLAMLERHVLQQRYHQAKLYVVSRIWMRFLGFVVGMTLALLGAAFILGKIREQGSSVEMTSENVRLSVVSSSPGIILSVLGAILMVTAMLASADIYTDDKATYTARWSQPPAKKTTTTKWVPGKGETMEQNSSKTGVDEARARIIDRARVLKGEKKGDL